MYIHTPWDIYVRQGDLEVSTRASGFGVDNVLRDTLAIECARGDRYVGNL